MSQFNHYITILTSKLKIPELKTLESDILNPDCLINLEINNNRRLISRLKKSRLNINPDIHHSKVPSSGIINI